MNGENSLTAHRRRATRSGVVGEPMTLTARAGHPVTESIERILARLTSSGADPTRRFVRLFIAFGLLLGTVIVGVGGSPASAAVLPVFPDNLVVFPNRDFISAEGFDAHVGENALVQVIRPGVGVIGGAEVEMGPGGVPFEVNHPGGFCWGNDIPGFRNGADPSSIPNITPDILPGDQVVLTFENPDPSYGASTDIETQDAFVTNVSSVTPNSPEPGQDPLYNNRFTVSGHIGGTVNPDNTEQRIVNPDLTDTSVAKRDIRAVPGGFAPNNTNVYLSNLEFGLDGPNTFRATYLFLEQDVATIAATGGGERLLSWQATDIAANRQGITIAEFGELGGPGFGGCPLGPNQSGPPGPSNVDTHSISSGSGHRIDVTWDPAISIPGAPTVTGYRVHAVAQTGTDPERVEIGRRISDPNATGTTIDGLDSNVTYDVQVVSVSDVGETFPAVHDTVAPALTADPAPGIFSAEQTVTLTTNDLNDQIWYTTDGTDVLDGAGDPVAQATPYTGPFQVAVTTTVHAVAFDPTGNASTQGSFVYTINNVPVPPTDLAANAGQFSVDLTWTEMDPTITGYGVQLYQGGIEVGAVIETPRVGGAGQSLTIGDLLEETTYTVTVMAGRGVGPFPGAYGDASAPVEFTTLGAPPLVVASAGGDQTVVRGDIVSLDGSASTGDTLVFNWASNPAVTLDDPTSATPSFTFPATLLGPVTLTLTVTDSATNAATDEVVVTPQAVVADAGADQSVVRGTLVTLNGTASSPANANLSYSWSSPDPAVVLSGATTATPSFTFPSTSPGPLSVALTVTDLSGDTATDMVAISAQNSDPLALARAQYRIGRNEWRLDGTATVAGPGNDITIRLNRTIISGPNAGTRTSTVLSTGTVPVDALGAWTVRFNPPPNNATNGHQRPVATNSTYTITITSSRGGLLSDEPITTRQ